MVQNKVGWSKVAVLREMVEAEYVRSCDLLDGGCEAEGGMSNNEIATYVCNTYQRTDFGGSSLNFSEFLLS